MFCIVSYWVKTTRGFYSGRFFGRLLSRHPRIAEGTRLKSQGAERRNIASIQMSQFVDKVINIDKLRLGTQSWYEDGWGQEVCVTFRSTSLESHAPPSSPFPHSPQQTCWDRRSRRMLRAMKEVIDSFCSVAEEGERLGAVDFRVDPSPTP